MNAELFSPYAALAKELLPMACADADGAHGFLHILRVWKNAFAIQAAEGGDGVILAASVLLHDCVAVEKNSPLRARASRLAAEKAAIILGNLGWSTDNIAATFHAIEAHSFSADTLPLTLEAKILHDADRLDAIGFIGIARCFYISGRLGRSLYDPNDPYAHNRQLDEQRHTMDHFGAKLLKLADGFQTKTGIALGEKRHKRLLDFYNGIGDEI